MWGKLGTFMAWAGSVAGIILSVAGIILVFSVSVTDAFLFLCFYVVADSF